ncbi:MAG: MFS transporter, partial [Novosphingobium sp.]|nr:MFS transporter [Novosphingobium sp.]
GIHYHVVGALMRPLTESYGWTRAETAFALTISSLLGPLANVAVGMLADRLGPRPVVLFGTLLFGASYMLFGLSGPALWTWYAAAAVYAILGHGVSTVVWTMAVVRRFDAGRGLALAISMSGSGVLVSLTPTIVLALVEWVGVRGTFFVLGVAAAIVMFVPAYFFFKDEDHGARPMTRAERSVQQAALPGLAVKQALLGTRFWRLAVALFIVSSTVGMFIVHFQSMLIDSGLSAGEAASAALMIGPMMILGRIGTGICFDRLPAPLVSGVAFAIPLFGCLLMLGFDGTMTLALIGAAIIGLGMGAEVDVVAFMTSRYFGLKRYGVLFGILIGLYGLGVALGSAVAGAVHDRLASYDPILVALGIGCGIASLMVATLGRPNDLARAERRAATGIAPAEQGATA